MNLHLLYFERLLLLSLFQHVTVDCMRAVISNVAEIIATTEPELAELKWVKTVRVSQDAQYYLTRLVMSDGTKAWSSPIWVNGK